MSNEEILSELRKLNKLMTLAYSDKITRELVKIASTNERKMIWGLIDGGRRSQDIADLIGISKRSVDRILKMLEDSGLIENPWGRPARRLFDYVPTEWLGLLPSDIEEDL